MREDGPDLRGEIEARLLVVERGCNALERELGRIRRDATAIQQQMWDQDIRLRVVAPPAPPPPPPVNTTITGTVSGCNSSHFNGLAVTVVDAGTGATLLTLTTSSVGVYSGRCYLAANTTVTVTSAGPNSRYAATTAVSHAVTAGVSNSIPVTLNTADGFACYSQCANPIPTTLTLTSDGVCSNGIYPNDTLVYQLRPSWASALISGFGWLGSAPINVPSGIGGGAGTYNYWMSAGGGLIRIRQSPSTSSWQLSPAANPTSCQPFSWTITCGSNQIGCTIHE